MQTKIKYSKIETIETIKEQFDKIVSNCKGLIFYRKTETQYFIKPANNKFLKIIKSYLS